MGAAKEQLTCYYRFSIIPCMNRLDSQTRTRILASLLEGCSIRSTVRMTGAAKKTVLRLLVEAGDVCAEYQDRVLRDLSCKRVQLDECWTFNYCKARQVTPEIAAKNPDAGDVWLWIALDADSRLVFSWRVGQRHSSDGLAFLQDVSSRLRNRVQITADGFPFYPSAIEEIFGEDVDFATLTKIYEFQHGGRYSPPRFISAKSEVIKGDPNPRHIATSYVERQNWALRTTVRRYTRLSNGFSRKLRNHQAAVDLNYFAYNFVRLHKSLRMSPAMAAGVADRLWEVEDIVALLEESERKKAA
jgi:IS1 family transposase